MIKKRIIPLMLLLLVTISLLCLSVNATYSRFGFNNNQIVDKGYWADTYFNYTASSPPLNYGQLTPLTADLDNDGQNEIVILDNGEVQVYKYNSSITTLQKKDGAGTAVSYFMLYDINGDGLTEIITLADHTIQAYNFSADSLTAFSTTASLNALLSSNIVFTCFGVQHCVAVAQKTPLYLDIIAQTFNMSYAGSTVSQTVTYPDCFPSTKSLTVGNLTNTTDTVVIGSSAKTAGTSVFYFRIDSAYNLVNGATGSLSTPASFTGSTCRDISTEFTNPILFNFDGSLSNGNEIVYGYRYQAGEFFIKALKSTFTTYNTYPIQLDFCRTMSGVFTGDKLSDPVVMSTNRYNYGNQDACILGWESSSGLMDLGCISATTTNCQKKSFEYITDQNYTTNLPVQSNTSTSIQNFKAVRQTHTPLLTKDNVPINDIVTTAGFFKLDDSPSCPGYSTGYGCLVPFQGVKISNASIIVDNKTDTSFGTTDIIGITNTNLWYIDDLSVNQQPGRTIIGTNPCTERPWNVNITGSFTYYVNDPDLDQVQYNYSTYVGLPNQQDTNWSLNFSSGTLFTVIVNANQTGSQIIARSCFRDTGTMVSQCVDIPFTVITAGGVNPGDCVGTIGTTTSTTQPCVGAGCLVAPDTVLDTGGFLKSIAAIFGLDPNVFWFLVMILTLIGLTVFGVVNRLEQGIIFFVDASVSVLLFVLGWFVGMINTVIFIVIIVLSIVILGLYFGGKITNSGKG